MNGDEKIEVQQTEDEESLFNEAKKVSLEKTKEFVNFRYGDFDDKPFDPDNIIEDGIKKLQEEGKTKKEIAEALKEHADAYSKLQEMLSYYDKEGKEILEKEFNKKMKDEFGSKSEIILNKANEFLKKNVGHDLNAFSFKNAKEKMGMVNKLYNDGKIFLEKPVKMGEPIQEKQTPKYTNSEEERKSMAKILQSFKNFG